MNKTYSAGTMGRVKLSVPKLVPTLFAKARASWKSSGLFNSRENEAGSLEVVVQLTVTGVPLAHPEGTEKVMADARGAMRARVLNQIITMHHDEYEEMKRT